MSKLETFFLHRVRNTPLAEVFFIVFLLPQYYDWERNRCTRYDWLEENSFSQIESDTEIPAELDPSQSKYFPEFEPHLLERMVGWLWSSLIPSLQITDCNIH